MSKVAVFSDIHANLAALDEVIADATEQNINTFACLGDVVGYGPNPSECVTRIQELKCVCVKGNHDEYVADDHDLSRMNDQATEALLWTRNNLSDSQKTWLAALPYTRRLGRNQLVHATLDNPENWDYVRNSFDAAIAMENQNTPICFYGHTHRPVAFRKCKGKTEKIVSDLIDLDDGCKYLINVGSVGQPRDGIAKASYIIMDRAAKTIEFRRLDYNLESVTEQILHTGLPDSLADRLIQAS